MVTKIMCMDDDEGTRTKSATAAPQHQKSQRRRKIMMLLIGILILFGLSAVRFAVQPRYSSVPTTSERSPLRVAGRQQQQQQQQQKGLPAEVYKNEEKFVDCINPLQQDEHQQEQVWNNIPHAIILGAQKSGTTELNRHFRMHPMVINRNREFHDLDYIVPSSPSSLSPSPANDPNHHEDIRIFNGTKMSTKINQRYFNKYHGRKMLTAQSPDYLSLADLVAPRVMCAAPNAKLIVLLRNPVSRAYSEYNMMIRQKKKGQYREGITFEEWIDADLQLMIKAGLHPFNSNANINGNDGNIISDEEKMAFQKYRQLATKDAPIGRNNGPILNIPVGRGLYALQIQFYWDAIIKTNNNNNKIDNDKVVNNQMIIMQSEKLYNETTNAYPLKPIFDFVGLPPLDDPDANPYLMKMSTEGGHHSGGNRKYDPMNDETKKKLDTIFKPYNDRLAKMLGEDEWKDAWI